MSADHLHLRNEGPEFPCARPSPGAGYECACTPSAQSFFSDSERRSLSLPFAQDHLLGDPAGGVPGAHARFAEADREDVGDLGQLRDALEGKDRISLRCVLVAGCSPGDEPCRVRLSENPDQFVPSNGHGVEPRGCAGRPSPRWTVPSQSPKSRPGPERGVISAGRPREADRCPSISGSEQ